MLIKETSVFTKIIQKLMDDDDYRELQDYLVKYPGVGDIIKGSGGLRKVRWSSSGKGKRGGLRVIYYWINEKDQIFMLYAYKKNQHEDLTNEQLKMLSEIVEEELNYESIYV